MKKLALTAAILAATSMTAFAQAPATGTGTNPTTGPTTNAPASPSGGNNAATTNSAGANQGATTPQGGPNAQGGATAQGTAGPSTSVPATGAARGSDGTGSTNAAGAATAPGAAGAAGAGGAMGATGTAPGAANADRPAGAAGVGMDSDAARDMNRDRMTGLPEGYAEAQAADRTVENLTGARVYSPDGDRIGRVSDLVLDGSDQITDIILDVGGFLGMGAHTVALPIDQVQIYWNQDDRAAMVRVDHTKDQLRDLPEYEKR